MRAGRLTRTLSAAVVLVVGAAGTGAAQTDYEITSALQFNFSNPGAKSLAMGGALTGLADDATGAWTNPAGLLNLSRPEMSLEFRAFEYSNAFTSAGHAFGTPSNVGVNTLVGLQESRLVDRAAAIAFASIVLPRDRWAVAFYRNQAAKFRTSIRTDGVFSGSAPLFRRLRPVEGGLDLDVAAYGASAATRVGDRVGFGAGVSVYHFSIDSLVERVSTTRVSDPTEPGGFFGPPLRTPENVVNVERQTGRQFGVGVNIGASVDVHRAVRFGASFRQGPVFQFDVQRVAGPGSANPGLVEFDRRGTFHMPDVYTAGVLLRPAEPVSFTLDYRRVQYSQLTQNFLIVIGEGQDEPTEFVMRDGNEVRVGAEYLFMNWRTPLAVRAGAWRDPDHRIRFEARDGRQSDSAIAFTRGRSATHVSGGFGLVFRSLQVDAAVDYAKPVITASVSVTGRF